VNWTDHACDKCRNRYRERWSPPNGVGGPAWVQSIFDAFPFPTQLVSDPHVSEWLERRKVTVSA
jgi:hypothetical protein